jgi:hypothetical protein
MSSLLPSSDNIFAQYFIIVINHVQKSVINLVEILTNSKVKERKKVKFCEKNEEEINIKKQKVSVKEFKRVYPNIPQIVRQPIEKPKITIYECNDDFDFFVYFD